MNLSLDATATMFVADSAEDDGRGTISAVGLGRRVVDLQADGNVPALAVVVLVDLPVAHAGSEFEIAVELRRSGALVEVPNINGAPGPVRIAAQLVAEPVFEAGADVPASVGARAQFVLNFPTGIPLAAGATYYWYLDIDGRHDRTWTVPFHVRRG